MANKRSWDMDHQKKRLDYLFRAYVRVSGDGWHVRRGMLGEVLRECGEHYSWNEIIHVGPTLEREEWAIFGFKEYEQKLKFEARLPAIMAVAIELPPGLPLPNGLADPKRDFTDLARRMVRKSWDDR